MSEEVGHVWLTPAISQGRGDAFSSWPTEQDPAVWSSIRVGQTTPFRKQRAEKLVPETVGNDCALSR